MLSVATLHGGVVVGHVARIISAACSVFIRGGVASCKVSGARQYSADLSQGGMEVPCKLTFTAASKEIDKNAARAVEFFEIFTGKIFTNRVQFTKFVKIFPLDKTHYTVYGMTKT